MNDRVSEELLAAAAGQYAAKAIAKVNVRALHFQDFITADGETLTTDSTKVAAVFGKPHNDLLKAIRALIAQLPADRQGYFSQTVASRINPSGGADIESTCYRITRDGFTLLAMGFTGKRALEFKLAYLDAFNAMAKYIKNQRDGLRYQCMEKELECRDSARRGSFHGKGLNQRKREKPVLEAQLSTLQGMAQTKLIPD
jgi:Rha family phage regulatory protein